MMKYNYTSIYCLAKGVETEKGGLAQLVERKVCILKVVGSIPASSTSFGVLSFLLLLTHTQPVPIMTHRTVST